MTTIVTVSVVVVGSVLWSVVVSAGHGTASLVSMSLVRVRASVWVRGLFWFMLVIGGCEWYGDWATVCSVVVGCVYDFRYRCFMGSGACPYVPFEEDLDGDPDVLIYGVGCSVGVCWSRD